MRMIDEHENDDDDGDEDGDDDDRNDEQNDKNHQIHYIYTLQAELVGCGDGRKLSCLSPIGRHAYLIIIM